MAMPEPIHVAQWPHVWVMVIHNVLLSQFCCGPFFPKRRTMKKLNKVAMLFASAAIVSAAGAQTVDNWRNGTNELVWKNGTNELCWRDANWTPATAAATCDGALKPAAAPAPAPANNMGSNSNQGGR